VRRGSRLWLACRSGYRDPSRAHGRSGYVRLFSAPADAPQEWTERELAFAGPPGEARELDAILSEPLPGLLLLISRRYASDADNQPFQSILSGDDLERAPAGRPLVIPRRPLVAAGCEVHAAYGHVRAAGDRLLMPVYGAVAASGYFGALLLESRDGGASWRLRTALAPAAGRCRYTNEFALLESDGHWLAVARCDTPPYPLLLGTSGDAGRSWSPLRPSGLHGQAPALLACGDGRILLVYRELRAADTAVAVAVRRPGEPGFRRLGELASYPGNPYDGGYADLTALDGDRILAVYYLSRGDGSPGIEGAVFTLG
jgi:hypothetical protein